MNRQDDLRKETPPHMNCQDWIKTSRTVSVCTNDKNGDFIETMDQTTDLTKLWGTIKGIDGRAKCEAENEAITFNGISFSSSKQLATKLNQPFNTSREIPSSDEGNHWRWYEHSPQT